MYKSQQQAQAGAAGAQAGAAGAQPGPDAAQQAAGAGNGGKDDVVEAEVVDK